MPKHKHCEPIKAWADGAKIQKLTPLVYQDDPNPSWDPDETYRLKPEPKWYEQIPDHGVLCWVTKHTSFVLGKSIDIIYKYQDGWKLPFHGLSICWRIAVPLTSEQIRKFLREE